MKSNNTKTNIDMAGRMLASLAFYTHASGSLLGEIARVSSRLPMQWRSLVKRILDARDDLGRLDVGKIVDLNFEEFTADEVADMSPDAVLMGARMAITEYDNACLESSVRTIVNDKNRPISDRLRDVVLLAEAKAKPTEVRVRTRTMRQILDLNIDHIPYLIEGVMAEAEPTIWAGPAGSAKSWALLELCRSLNSGENWLGQRLNRGGPSLIFDLENGSPRLCIRSRNLGFTGDERVHFLTDNDAQGIYIEDEAFVSRVADLVKTLPAAPVLIAFDSWSRFTRCDENAAGEVALCMSNLWSLSRALGVVVIILHHTRKSAPNDRSANADKVRGSGDFVNAVSNALFFSRADEGFMVEQIKSRDAQAIEPFGFTLVNKPFSNSMSFKLTADPEPKKSSLQKCMEAVLEAVLNDPGISKKTLKERKLGSDSTITRAIEALESDGEIDVTKTAQGRGKSWILYPHVIKEVEIKEPETKEPESFLNLLPPEARM